MSHRCAKQGQGSGIGLREQPGRAPWGPPGSRKRTDQLSGGSKRKLVPSEGIAFPHPSTTSRMLGLSGEERRGSLLEPVGGTLSEHTEPSSLLFLPLPGAQVDFIGGCSGGTTLEGALKMLLW